MVMTAKVKLGEAEMADYMNLKDAAKFMGISSATLSKLVKQGKIQAVQVGRQKMIERDRIVEFMSGKSQAEAVVAKEALVELQEKSGMAKAQAELDEAEARSVEAQTKKDECAARRAKAALNKRKAELDLAGITDIPATLDKIKADQEALGKRETALSSRESKLRHDIDVFKAEKDKLKPFIKAMRNSKQYEKVLADNETMARFKQLINQLKPEKSYYDRLHIKDYPDSPDAITARRWQEVDKIIATWFGGGEDGTGQKNKQG